MPCSSRGMPEFNYYRAFWNRSARRAAGRFRASQPRGHPIGHKSRQELLPFGQMRDLSGQALHLLLQPLEGAVAHGLAPLTFQLADPLLGSKPGDSKEDGEGGGDG